MEIDFDDTVIMFGIAVVIAVGGILYQALLHRDTMRPLLGYLAVTFGFSLEFYGRDAFIDELFIRPAFRGRGLGARALQSVEPECRALGVRALHLEVERDNAVGRELYRKQGFLDNERQLLSKRLTKDD